MDFVEDIFLKKAEEVDLTDIDTLIQSKREEGRNLEYKAASILGEPEKLSGWVSAFLNTDGGLIIIGICEDDPNEKDRISARILPVRREFVDKAYTRERVEQLIFSHVRCSARPRIDIHSVRDPSDPSKALYLLNIPQGENPPYQASDGKYYRRLNATKYAMSHTEIADFFGRRKKPVLDVSFRIASLDPSESSFTLRAFVSNKGKAAARHSRVSCLFVNIEILKVTYGNVQRIDEIRNNNPSLQWDYDVSVIHAVPGNVRIWDVVARLNQQEGQLLSVALAEDMETAPR